MSRFFLAGKIQIGTRDIFDICLRLNALSWIWKKINELKNQSERRRPFRGNQKRGKETQRRDRRGF